MKVKTLRSISTGEFIHLLTLKNGTNCGTCALPTIMGSETTIEDLKQYYGDVDFTDIELVILEIHNNDEFNADIRNKLTPVKNLIALLESDEVKGTIKSWVRREIEQVKKSIEYLKNI